LKSQISFFIRKITLRAYVVFLAFTSFIAIVLYIMLRSRVDLTISGNLDVNIILTAFISLISVIMGWLFGRYERAR
jgi:hypothetical protein